MSDFKTNWDDPILGDKDQASGELGGGHPSVENAGPDGLAGLSPWGDVAGCPPVATPGGQPTANSVSGLKEVQINDMYPSPAEPPQAPSLNEKDPGTIDQPTRDGR